ncbi:MAG: hypothetical protein H7281_06705 [Bacteriovorax sp.]|nr:hypothetical protein [Bacteriovorax sp.]
MTSLSKKNKIIWSFDPTQDPAEAKNITKELKILAKPMGLINSFYSTMIHSSSFTF